MRRRSKKSFPSQEELDLTPLIDCVFLLLIFFMVTTVFVQARGVSVDLPVPTSAQDEQQRRDINVVLESSGRVEVSGEEVAWEHLERRIARAMKENNNDNVMILADREAVHQLVIDVVDAAKAAGARGIAFSKTEGE
jgi:biopolymer transport protein ExbD